MRDRHARRARIGIGLGLSILALCLHASCAIPEARRRDAFERARAGAEGEAHAWRSYLADPGRSHWSPLAQIHPGNVDRLEVAWTYDTREARRQSEIQCNPIVVRGVLYASSPRPRVFTLDPSSGRELWSFRPDLEHATHANRERRGA